MKRIVLAAIVLVLALPIAVTAQSSQKLDKATKKEFNTKKKELKKEGWVIYGSSKSLDNALLAHYSMLAKLGDNAEEIIGSAPKCNNKDAGHLLAANNAASKYAQQCNITLKGTTQSIISSGNGEEIDQFFSSYQSHVEVAIKDELQESFSIVKEVEPGMYEVMSFFILKKNKAAMVHLAALEKIESQMNTASIFIKELKETSEEKK